MQFHYCLIVHQRPPNFHVIYNGFNLTVFDGLSNDNEIIRNLIDHQSKDIKKIILKFFYIYLEVHCQGCQNNPLSMDPHSLEKY
jgi:hypothetical protein